MGNIVVISGAVTIVYTSIAYFFGLPQVTDFLSVDLFSGNKDVYIKVVRSTDTSVYNYYTVGVGIFLVIAGFFIKSKSAK